MGVWQSIVTYDNDDIVDRNSTWDKKYIKDWIRAWDNDNSISTWDTTSTDSCIRAWDNDDADDCISTWDKTNTDSCIRAWEWASR